MIDLRSDTQTQPSPGMRAAMASAEVGDEQQREDPTVIALERRAAAFLGQEDAVYLPTATMGNQIALQILSEPGDELIVEESAHIMISELGGAAVHSGLQTRGLPGRRGRLSPEALRTAVHPARPAPPPARRAARAREHPQQRRGHRLAGFPSSGRPLAAARELGLAVHLDGARIANAAVATGIAAAEIGRLFDTGRRSASRRASAARSARWLRARPI